VVSKTALLNLVKAFRWRDVARGLDENPALLGYRDDRGRGWLHLCCGVDVKAKSTLPVKDSVRLARLLIDRGIGINTPAFTEGAWHATPLWYAVGRGHNLVLAKYLLEEGADPNHCLWAAVHGNDFAAIKLLVRHGATIDPVVEDATPFLEAVKWSHFDAARVLLGLGADVNFQDTKKMTALHYMLKKGSDLENIRMLIDHGARGDLSDQQGVTVAQIMRKKRDPEFQALAARLVMT
jgi:uncharacterized protein